MKSIKKHFETLEGNLLPLEHRMEGRLWQRSHGGAIFVTGYPAKPHQSADYCSDMKALFLTSGIFLY